LLARRRHFVGRLHKTHTAFSGHDRDARRGRCPRWWGGGAGAGLTNAFPRVLRGRANQHARCLFALPRTLLPTACCQHSRVLEQAQEARRATPRGLFKMCRTGCAQCALCHALVARALCAGTTCTHQSAARAHAVQVVVLRLEALLNAALPGCYVCARARAQVARGVARRLVRGVATALRPRTPRRSCLRAEQETGNGPLQSRSTSDAQDHTFRRRNPPGRCRGCTSWQSDAVQQITTATAARSKRLDGPSRAIPLAECTVFGSQEHRGRGTGKRGEGGGNTINPGWACGDVSGRQRLQQEQ